MPLLLFLLGFALPASAPPIWGPLTPGPHRAGISHIHASGNLEITYWYPAIDRRHSLTLDDLASSRAAFSSEAGIDGLPEAVIRRYGSQGLYASTGAPPVQGRFPLVLFAQGNQQRPLHQAVLAEFLASHGFVVASAASTTIAAPITSEDDVRGAAQREAEQLESIRQAMVLRPEVNPGRVAVAGHSFGARAALLAAMHDGSIRALVSLDGGIGTAQAVQSFRRAPWFAEAAAVAPILHLYETTDSFMSPDFQLLRSLRARDLKLRRIDALHHAHFTTLGFGGAADSELGKAVNMTPAGRAGLRDMSNAVLAFLQRHLR